MTDFVFKAAYLIGIVAEMAIRTPYNRQRRQNTVVTNQFSTQEIIVLVLFFAGNLILPLVYIFTPWLHFANYSLPAWAGWIGIAIIISAIVVFWRSHVDLGQNWSPTLQIREGHALVTAGLYRYIRHPMYASQWLWVIAQALLLQNWIAGVGGLILFLPLYLVRVPREEQMMAEQFGAAYRDYMQRTGRVVPRLSSRRSP